jgi:hypothetical protein
MPVAFDEVVEKINDAARNVEADEGASPVLVAVVREFEAKLTKAEQCRSRHPQARLWSKCVTGSAPNESAALRYRTSAPGQVRPCAWPRAD